MPTEICLTKVGMTMSEGVVAQWYVADGAAVEKGALLYRLETEKVELEVDADASGTVKHLVAENVTLPLVLIGSEAELKEAVFRLHRVAHEGSVLPFEAWTKAGLPVATSGTITPAELYQQMQNGNAPIIVDVRMPYEWMALRIGTVVNLPINQLADLSGKLDPNLPVVAVCNSAYRSSLAVGILQRKGFKNVSSLDGGSAAWIDAGYPVYGNESKPTASAPQRQIQIAERISPADLGRLIKDLPGTFDLGNSTCAIATLPPGRS